MTRVRPWWQTAVIYQIYPRSFADGNGDGIGDLEGIRRRLDHLEWLGIDAVWLSPIYPSPMADGGYDVADHCDVDPRFGTLADFDRLLADAHARGIRVLLDWVPNHTSDRHPWFIESRARRTSPRRSWYVWRDPGPGGGPPNNWRAAFAARPAWTLDPRTGQYYLHCFLPSQPDLDWREPAVVRAMHDVLRFWLARGVDGFRCDVVHLIGKDGELADDAPEVAAVPHVVVHDRPETHALLRDVRRMVDSWSGDRVLVGEVFLLDTRRVAAYHGRGDELHLVLNFPPLYAAWDSGAWRDQIETAAAAFDPAGAWPTWVLSNHDNPRHRTRYGGGEGRARAAAVLLLTLRGTPFLYQGEELGLENAVVPPEAAHDPGGRDGGRAPMPWEPSMPHGWYGASPWLPFPPAAPARSVAALAARPESILHLYRRLIRLRAETAALRQGDLALLDAPDGLLAFERTDGTSRVRVLVNFRDRVARLPEIRGVVLASSAGLGEGRTFDGTLGPDEAVVVSPPAA